MDSIDMNKVCRKDIVISLTPVESQLFSILMQANCELQMNSTLRVAGGWVRDKILGMQSHDIDIAIDNMTGFEFVERLPAWLTEKGYNTSNIGKIKANPDKSKHLETATIRIIDNNIDFVNLRKEEYTDDSRIPTMEIGTPLEDAYRRDLTINSLFYNINTFTVEDFTMRGVDDLLARIVRTPLPACETFQEDPLRILRTVRFATRYNCSIMPDIMEAARDPDIELFLSRKVSRERIGVEFLKMAQSDNFTRAMQIIEEMNIMNSVFNVEGDNSNYLRTQKNRTLDEFNESLFLIHMPIDAVESVTTLDAKYMNSFFSNGPCDSPLYKVKSRSEDFTTMNGNHKYLSFIRERVVEGMKYLALCERVQQTTLMRDTCRKYGLDRIVSSIEESPEAILRMSCLLFCFSYSFLCGQMYLSLRKKTWKQSVVLSPLIKHFIRENLKLKNSVVDNVCWIVHREHDIAPFLNMAVENEGNCSNFSSSDVVILGNIIYSSKQLWPLMLQLAMTEMMIKEEVTTCEDPRFNRIIIGFDGLVKYIRDKDLSEVWEIQSVIDGNELCCLGVAKGPGMKNVMDDIRDWMILHPHGTKEECIDTVIRRYIS